MVNASASSVRTGDKVIVTDRIPPRVLNSHGDVELQGEKDWDDTPFQNGIPRGATARIKDVGTVTVTLAWELKNVQVTSFKDHVFEKYFAVLV